MAGNVPGMAVNIEPGTAEYRQTAEMIRNYVRSLSPRWRGFLLREIERRPGKFSRFGKVQLELLKAMLADPDVTLETVKPGS